MSRAGFEYVNVIKIKHTADEIMAIFPTAPNAPQSAIRLKQAIAVFLSKYNLSTGIGIHHGYLVERLIDSRDVKIYDVIGDTINTAKRICDQSRGNEILVFQQCYLQLKGSSFSRRTKVNTSKGKK